MRVVIDANEIPAIVDMMDAYPERAKKAIVSAINRSIAGVRTDSAKKVTEAYNIKQKDVRAVTSMYRASLGRLIGEVTLKGKPIRLEKFSPTPRVLGTKRPKDGVSVRIRRSGKTIIKGSFLGNSAVRKEGGTKVLRVLKRSDESPKPLEFLTGPSVSQMVSKSDKTELYDLAKERFIKNYMHMIKEGYKHVKERKRK